MVQLDWEAVPWRCDCAGFDFAVSCAVLDHEVWRRASEMERRTAVFRARRARRDGPIPVVTFSDLDLASVAVA